MPDSLARPRRRARLPSTRPLFPVPLWCSSADRKARCHGGHPVVTLTSDPAAYRSSVAERCPPGRSSPDEPHPRAVTITRILRPNLPESFRIDTATVAAPGPGPTPPDGHDRCRDRCDERQAHTPGNARARRLMPEPVRRTTARKRKGIELSPGAWPAVGSHQSGTRVFLGSSSRAPRFLRRYVFSN